ncbi:MAG: response regulator transcription factor [Myxococcota bacterium]|nr:response regulator transcription factor [Myxococcota bacterium]
MIDDDAELAAMVGDYLRPAGFDFENLPTLEAARRRLETADVLPDLLLLDLMLPDGDGLDTCRELRAAERPELRTLPILMLTARGDDVDRILGLELGADDYLAKPFNPRELLARIRAILRRRPTDDSAPRTLLRFGRLSIDCDARVARLDDEPCDLTPHQFELLRVLAENAGRVLSRDAIMQALRGHAVEAFDRSIDVHVSRIRAAIESDPSHPRRILTLRGAGYLFARNPDEPDPPPEDDGAGTP